jgi:acyl-CoA synthetase (AMP-forming)/AMP-acid ligase II
VRTIVTFDAGPDAWQRYDAWRDAAAESDPHGDTAEDETAWQLYTSGTTGRPKGAELTHRNLLANISIGAVGFGVSEGGVGLVCMPLYHIGGAGYGLCLIFAGMTAVVMREPNPAEILRLIQKHRVAHAFFVPALLNFLLQHPDSAGTDFSSLQTILYGASPIPEELLRASIDRFGCGFVQAYGLTETTGAVCLLSAEDHLKGGELLRSCGQPVFGCEIRVIDGAGKDCAPGTVGEIVMRGDAVMKGYWNRPEATAEAIRDGVFRSGDAGYFDKEGYLFIHDRVKDMIVSGGENIYPAEVESVLYSHPAVADVAVIGVPDDKWGETVKAIVVVKPGAKATAEELIDHCRDKIAGYKRPRSVDFIDALPRNPTGKILKAVLREPYWAGKQRRVN